MEGWLNRNLTSLAQASGICQLTLRQCPQMPNMSRLPKELVSKARRRAISIYRAAESFNSWKPRCTEDIKRGRDVAGPSLLLLLFPY
jgi:hypothetical protein